MDYGLDIKVGDLISHRGYKQHARGGIVAVYSRCQVVKVLSSNKLEVSLHFDNPMPDLPTFTARIENVFPPF